MSRFSLQLSIYRAVPSLVWVHWRFLELSSATHFIYDFSKVLQKSRFSTIQCLFEKGSPRTGRKAEPKGDEPLQKGKPHCQSQGFLTADQRKGNGHPTLKSKTKLEPRISLGGKKPCLISNIGTVPEVHILGSPLEVRGRHRGVTWVCVLAGINSQNHHLGCVCEREKEIGWGRRAEKERKERAHMFTAHLDGRFLQRHPCFQKMSSPIHCWGWSSTMRHRHFNNERGFSIYSINWFLQIML